MGSSMARLGTLGGAAAIVFIAAVAIGLRLVPGKPTDTDYLVVGAIATFLSMGVLFAVLITTWIKSPDVFFKKRTKGGDEPSEPPAGQSS